MFAKTFEMVGKVWRTVRMVDDVLIVDRDETEDNEIHNIVRPELEPRVAGDDTGTVWNFLQAFACVVGGFIFLWLYLAVTAPL